MGHRAAKVEHRDQLLGRGQRAVHAEQRGLERLGLARRSRPRCPRRRPPRRRSGPPSASSTTPGGPNQPSLTASSRDATQACSPSTSRQVASTSAAAPGRGVHVPGPRLAAEQRHAVAQHGGRAVGVHVDPVVGPDVHHAVVGRDVQRRSPYGRRRGELLRQPVHVRELELPGLRGHAVHGARSRRGRRGRRPPACARTRRARRPSARRARRASRRRRYCGPRSAALVSPLFSIGARAAT